MNALVLPSPIQQHIEAMAQGYFSPEDLPDIDFANPRGAAALIAPDSLSWRVFKNPVTLFIGGVTAVLLELAEARIRSGVWDHTTFRTDPVPRLKRTGLAAMVSFYAPRETAEAMIRGINQRHAAVQGVAEDGQAYTALDPMLLDWVQATAIHGFTEAYHRFVQPLSEMDRDRIWRETRPVAQLYGAMGAPETEAQWHGQLQAMIPLMTASPIVFEFLEIMRSAPALPALARPYQHLLVHAAVDALPAPVSSLLGLEARHGLVNWQRRVVVSTARAAERLPLYSAPPAQACVRMGLPADWLYRDAVSHRHRD